MAAQIVISPHLDDAVFSCFTLMTDPGRFREFAGGGEGGEAVHVVNVFCAFPDGGVLGDWDETCGARSSWAQLHKRIGEDAEIFARLGVPSHYLAVLDKQYRNALPEPDASSIAERIVDAVEVDEDTTVWMPWARDSSGSPTHDDHLLARTAAELVVGDTGARARYYADLPYLHDDILAESRASHDALTIWELRADRAKLGVSRSYVTQWKHLPISWRQLKHERYVKVTA